MGAGAPCFGSFVRRATEADLSPHPLLDTQSPVARTQSTPASPHARAERFDSVYDVYAELYADDDDEGAEGAEGYGEDDQLGELQRGRGVHDYEPEPELPSEDYDEPTEPWDERGKTGLYGGGGRGADDRETGWVSDFTFSLISPGAGHEEDLRFGGDDDGGPRSRQLSRATQGSRAVGGTEQPRRESIETAPSSKGPVTPPDVGSAASLQSSSRENVHPRSMSPALPPPIHTVDAARIKKSKQSPRIPTPSAPIPAGRGVGPLDRSAARPRPKASGGFKWPVRSKKAPIISAPILPEGFVESLGMETFALHPGVKLPQRASMSATGQSRSSSLSPRDIASPNPQQQRAAPTRKAAPLVAQPPTRTEDRPQLVERNGTLSRTTSTSRPTSRLGPVLEESASAPTSRAQTPQRPQHERTASSTTVGSGFRDPWSTAGANRASMHSQQTRTAGARSSYQGGSERASLASTVAVVDPRHPSSSNGGGALRYSPVEASPISPAPASPVVHDTRHDSLSSHYSEVSDAPHSPPAGAHHSASFDAFRQDFTPFVPFSTTAHLRGAGAATFGSTTRGGDANAFEPVRPLNFQRRTSTAYQSGGAGDESKRSTLAGDVVWGGVGAGGPRDTSSQAVSRAMSPFAGRAASPFAQHAPTIGTTGFRNPFG